MFMMPPPKARTRFADWKFAMKSILGFWIFYGLTVVARAFLGSDPSTVVVNKLAVISAGILFTFAIYATIATFASGATIRRKVVVAGIASAVASVLMGGTLIAADDMSARARKSSASSARRLHRGRARADRAHRAKRAGTADPDHAADARG